MKHNIVFVAATLFPFIALAQSVPENVNIRKMYSDRSTTPTSLVYKDYVGFVHYELSKGQETAENAVMYTLGIDDRELAADSIRIFEAAHWVFRQDELDTQITYMCRETAERWTDKHIFMAMDTIDDVIELLADKRYRSSVLKLDTQVIDPLHVFLDEHKDAYTYIALDHEVAWKYAEPYGDMQQIADDICDNVSSERNRLFSGTGTRE